MFSLACGYTVAVASAFSAVRQPPNETAVTLIKPSADCSDTLWERGIYKIIRAGHRGWSIEGDH